MYVTKEKQATATKAKLERVARDLFGTRGFAEVSAEELVARAGVTRGALYHPYNGKEGLYEAVVEGAMKELHEKLAAEAAGARDPLDGLARGIRAFLTRSTQPALQRVLLIDAPAVLGWHQWRKMDDRYGLGLLKRALAGGVKTGLLRDQDPDVMAHLLQGALTEAALVIARSRQPSKARKDAERAIASIVAGWRRRESD